MLQPKYSVRKVSYCCHVVSAKIPPLATPLNIVTELEPGNETAQEFLPVIMERLSLGE